MGTVRTDNEIVEMLDTCMNHLEGSALEFIESLNDYYEKNGKLTEKQIDALTRFHDNI